MKNFINFSMSVRSSQSLGKKARSSSIVSSVSNKNKRKTPRINISPDDNDAEENNDDDGDDGDSEAAASAADDDDADDDDDDDEKPISHQDLLDYPNLHSSYHDSTLNA